MNEIIITLPYHGDISVNHYLGRAGGREYIKDTARLWRMVVKGAVNACLPMGYHPVQLNKTHPFDMDITVRFPRKFSTRSGDATNFDKFIRDSVAQALGVDDANSEGKQDATYGNGSQANIEVRIKLNFNSDEDGFNVPKLLSLCQN